jgi:hypothetical protein
MQQQQTTPTRGLIATSGMKTSAQWGELDMAARVAWLDTLTALGLRAQASVLAVAERRDMVAVLNEWADHSLINPARVREALEVRQNAARGGE